MLPGANPPMISTLNWFSWNISSASSLVTSTRWKLCFSLMICSTCGCSAAQSHLLVKHCVRNASLYISEAKCGCIGAWTSSTSLIFFSMAGLSVSCRVLLPM